MSDIEYYSWIAFFIVGVVALPFMFHHRKAILRRIHAVAVQAKANALYGRRPMGIQDKKVDPWKDTYGR